MVVTDNPRPATALLHLFHHVAGADGDQAPAGVVGLADAGHHHLSGYDVRKAIKPVADMPLTSRPLRLRNEVYSVLAPVAVEGFEKKQKLLKLPLALVEQILEDNETLFLDEGLIKDPAVFKHDLKLIVRLVALLLFKNVHEDRKQAYRDGLVLLLLAERHIAELSLANAQLLADSLQVAGGEVSESARAKVRFFAKMAERLFKRGLGALRKGRPATASVLLGRSWKFSNRVLAVLDFNYEGDHDGDGVVDVVELRIGSSPFTEDTDADGLSDAFELNATIPHTLPDVADTDGDGVPDGEEDLDGDGLTNLEERDLGTDPLLPDTDRDGLTDDEELTHGLNPLDADTDRDGLTDDSELRLGTDPLAPDSDGDGILDGEDEHLQTLADTEIGATVELLGVGDHSRSFRVHRMADVAGLSDVPGLVGAFVDLSSDLPVTSATVRLQYDPTLVPEGDFESLRLFQYDPENALLEPLDNQRVDVADNQVSGETGALGPVGIVHLPTWEMALESQDQPLVRIKTALDQTLTGQSASRMAGPSTGPTQSNVTAVGDQIVIKVSDGDDDAGPNPDQGCVYSTDWNEVYFGECFDGKYITSGFRFDGVPIPQGTAIESAIIEFTVDGPYDDRLTLDIYGETAVDALPFSVTRPSERDPTDAVVRWLIPASDYWELNDTRQTPDLTSIIQEIVDQPGWREGNALAIIVENVGPAIRAERHRRVIGIERPRTTYVGDVARLIITLADGAQDSDNDGLTDAEELAGFRTQFGNRVFTDPFKADTDGDGIPDGQEIGNRTGSFYRILADPTKADTDRDGVEDFVELRDLANPTKPFDPDSDDDGLSDGEEVNDYATDPLVRDTDGDGFTDGDEVRSGEDPLLAVERQDPLKTVTEFAVGALCGEFCLEDHGNMAFFSGFFISGAISVIPSPVTTVIGLIADLRDFLASLVKGDWIGLGFNTLALVPWVGDASDALGTTGRFVTKHVGLVGEVGPFVSRLDWLPETLRIAAIRVTWGDEVVDALDDLGFDGSRALRLGKAGVNLEHLRKALRPLLNDFPGLDNFLRGIEIDDFTGILRGNGLTANLKGLAVVQLEGRTKSVLAYLSNIKGAYTELVMKELRNIDIAKIIREHAHVNAPGYDLVAEMRSGIVRLMEAKSGSATLKQLSNYLENATGSLVFNTDYFRIQGLLDIEATKSAFRSGRLEVEILINNPDSARIAKVLLDEMGGTIAAYADDLGNPHTLNVIVTAVSR